jgi:hypothetical protein
MQDTPRIRKVVRRYNAQEEPTDFAYWQSQSYEPRLLALERIRREYHQWKYGAEPRLQRVCTIIKLTKSAP